MPSKRLPQAPRSRDPLAFDVGRSIPRDEIGIRVSRSGGSGGQHVNKTSTRVEVVWNPSQSRALSDEERQRVVAVLARRIDSSGLLHVTSSESRSQLQNRESAEARLAAMVARALVPRKARRATAPTRAAREARLETKKVRGRTKAARQRSDWTE